MMYCPTAHNIQFLVRRLVVSGSAAIERHLGDGIAAIFGGCGMVE
jgi:hypothetical protein